MKETRCISPTATFLCETGEHNFGIITSQLADQTGSTDMRETMHASSVGYYDSYFERATVVVRNTDVSDAPSYLEDGRAYVNAAKEIVTGQPTLSIAATAIVLPSDPSASPLTQTVSHTFGTPLVGQSVTMPLTATWGNTDDVTNVEIRAPQNIELRVDDQSLTSMGVCL